MRNIILILFAILCFSAFPSCEKQFLDKAPGVDVSEDTIFSSKSQVETFIAGTYGCGMFSGLPYWDFDFDVSAPEMCATDEGDAYHSWTYTQEWNKGTISPVNTVEYMWPIRWRAIRNANILLERIEEVPNVDQTYINQVKGEATFLRAFNYFEMFKRYGGVPIVNKRFKLTDDYFLPRSSVEEVVNFIVSDCDLAASLLPDLYPANMTGRATKGAALALKSKTLLYAASPLFNTASPVISLGANDKMICYGNEDNNRWQLAADAAKAVINWAPAGGCHLITDQGPDKNYRYVWEVTDNAEVILAEKIKDPRRVYDFPYLGTLPCNLYNGDGSGIVTQSFVMFYEKKDGTPQTWDMVNGGTDLNQKYAELDYRFKQSVAYNGSYWNPDYPEVQIFQGGPQALNCTGGAWMLKWHPAALTASVRAIPNFTLFRLAEAYMNLAEALNEAQGPVNEAYDAINTIRSRSGMPDLPRGLTKDQFRARVRNERTIEMAFESHRLWDIIRWRIAANEGIMNGNMWGIKIYKIDGTNPAEYRYEPYVFEVRTFKPAMYLTPFPQNEVNKGYLVQNPGY